MNTPSTPGGSGPARRPVTTDEVDAAEPGGAVRRLALLRRWRTPVVLWAFTVVCLIGFATTADAGGRSTFPLSVPGDVLQLGDLVVPTLGAVIILCVAAGVLAGLATWRAAVGEPPLPVVPGAVATLLVVAFLVWAVEGGSLPMVNLLRGSLFLAMPLIFGALSGVVSERAGVINIAIDGHLLAGAFAGAVVATLTGNPYIGLLGAALSGVAVSALLAVFAIRYAVDQVVLGFVINLLVVGLTNFLYGQLLSKEPSRWNNPDSLGQLPIPLLSDIPVLGPVLFDQTILGYAMYAAIGGLSYALFRTRWGLRVRAVGEHPKAADTAGIDVNAVRWRSVLYAGAVAGFGGAAYSLVIAGQFQEEMTGGGGFIALAAMIFGRWSPLRATAAALLFGFAANLQSNLGLVSDAAIPSEFLLMAPYLVTIFAVAGVVGRVRAPAADGVPYRP